MTILFVDDMKYPRHFGLPDNTPIARTAEVAWRIAKRRSVNKPIEELWLDHDLSEDGMNGFELLRKMVERGMAPKKVVCISYNIPGVERIQNYCMDNDIPYERRMMQ